MIVLGHLCSFHSCTSINHSDFSVAHSHGHLWACQGLGYDKILGIICRIMLKILSNCTWEGISKLVNHEFP